ncbi:MAG: cysteine dioxygenase family protein [Rhodospirillaceae bacterium]
MMHIEEFCETVGAIVSNNPVADVPRRIAAHLPALLANRALLRPDQMTLPAEGYGRHEIFLCPGDMFSIIAAVWPAGYMSPIHDHMTWCTFGVFEGEIQETRFRRQADESSCKDAVATAQERWGVGDVAHLPVGSGDIHCMYNPGDRPAVSLHVYGGNSAKLGPNVVNIYRETARAFT